LMMRSRSSVSAVLCSNVSGMRTEMPEEPGSK